MFVPGCAVSWYIFIPRQLSTGSAKCPSGAQTAPAFVVIVVVLPTVLSRGLHSGGCVYRSLLLVLACSLHRCSEDDQPHEPEHSKAHRLASQLTDDGVLTGAVVAGGPDA